MSRELLVHPPHGTQHTGDIASVLGSWATLLNNHVLSRGQAQLSVVEYGATGNGVADDTVALTAAITAWKNTVEAELIIPHGTYLFSSLPNLLNPGGTLRGIGRPVLKHTGTGRAIEVSDAATNYYVQTIRNIVVQGNANTTDGWYFDHIHHGVFEDLEVRGCNAAAFRIHFSVLNVFRNLIASANHAAFSTTPVNGLVLGTGTASSSSTTANMFENCMIEGVSGDGVILENAAANTFVGGTSEGNTGRGVYAKEYGWGNTFDTLFCEANGGMDFENVGRLNIYRNCNGTSSGKGIKVTGGRNVRFEGGTYLNIDVTSGAERTHFEQVNYLSTLTDNGARTTWRNMQVGGASWNYEQHDKPVYSTPSMLNSWGGASGSYTVPGFAMLANRYVRLCGNVAGGSSGTSMFELPAENRPALRHRFVCASDVATDVVIVDVYPDGNVMHVAGSTSWCSLDGITFPV